jgi:hypothetical protein
VAVNSQQQPGAKASGKQEESSADSNDAKKPTGEKEGLESGWDNQADNK